MRSNWNLLQTAEQEHDQSLDHIRIAYAGEHSKLTLIMSIFSLSMGIVLHISDAELKKTSQLNFREMQSPFWYKNYMSEDSCIHPNDHITSYSVTVLKNEQTKCTIQLWQ